MIVSESSITLDGDNTFRIYPCGDIHYTLRTCKVAELKAYLQAILDDPAGLAIQLGDVSDARDRSHRYFDPGMVHPRYRIEDVDILEDLIAEEVAELFEPLAKAGRLLGFLRGNHHQAGFTRRLTRELSQRSGQDVPDLGDRAMVRLVATQQGAKKAQFGYTVFATHVDAGGRKPGAQINRQLDTQLSFDADLYLYGHSHAPSAQESLSYSVPRGALRLKPRSRLHINAGAWLEGVTAGANSYAGAKNLPARADTVWYAEVALRGRHHDVLSTPRVWRKG